MKHERAQLKSEPTLFKRPERPAFAKPVDLELLPSHSRRSGVTASSDGGDVSDTQHAFGLADVKTSASRIFTW